MKIIECFAKLYLASVEFLYGGKSWKQGWEGWNSKKMLFTPLSFFRSQSVPIWTFWFLKNYFIWLEWNFIQLTFSRVYTSNVYFLHRIYDEELLGKGFVFTMLIILLIELARASAILWTSFWLIKLHKLAYKKTCGYNSTNATNLTFSWENNVSFWVTFRDVQ